MKNFFSSLLLFCLFGSWTHAQINSEPRIIVITSDGVRWQEVFFGLDTTIARNEAFAPNKGANLIKEFYEKDFLKSRKKIMPFFWTEIVRNGEIHGNRTLGSQVDVANPYWFSYPGYSELLTGQVDTLINSNDYMPNPHPNFFEHLNSLPAYKGRVAAFGAWDAFDRILNEERSKMPVVDAFDPYEEVADSPNAPLLSRMAKNSFRPFGDAEILDVFTHYQAMDYLKNVQPKALYISYGETDEFAHEGNYEHYIHALNRFDGFLKEIWDFVESTPGYKDNTILLISTDHGRGDQDKSQWTSHGQEVLDSHQTWYAIFGKGVSKKGEINQKEQVYSRELIHRLAEMAHIKF